MTPQEKAITLRDKFIEATKVPNVKGIWVEDFEGAKQCALICVNEIQEHTPMIKVRYENYANPYEYFKDVELELEKL